MIDPLRPPRPAAPLHLRTPVQVDLPHPLPHGQALRQVRGCPHPLLRGQAQQVRECLRLRRLRAHTGSRHHHLRPHPMVQRRDRPWVRVQRRRRPSVMLRYHLPPLAEPQHRLLCQRARLLQRALNRSRSSKHQPKSSPEHACAAPFRWSCTPHEQIRERKLIRMPPIKAPKKAAKKAANKQSPEHQQERHANDTRRCYEHLGRVEILSASLSGDPLAKVHELVNLAQAFLGANHAKHGADLLRAAEHLCFAVVLEEQTAHETVNKSLEEAIKKEWQHLQDRAADHASQGDMPSSVQALYSFMSQASASAMKTTKYRCALEMGRGAEALAHVSNDVKALASGGKNKLLSHA